MRVRDGLVEGREPGRAPASRVPSPNASDHDPGGPLVGVCTGHRCAAVWMKSPPAQRSDAGPRGRQDAPDAGAEPTSAAVRAKDELWSVPGPRAFREAVLSSTGAVLLSLECSGVCAVAPVVLVGHRGPTLAQVRPPLWVACADRPGRPELILEWLDGSWHDGIPAPPDGLRPALRRVVVDRPAPAALPPHRRPD